MLYDPRAQNPFAAYVTSWQTSPDLSDPFEQFVAFHKAEADYLRTEYGDDDRARTIERVIGRLENLIEAIRETPLSYADAEKVSVWKHGTIKNKSTAGEIETEGGKVAVAQLAIGPDAPGLQALRFVEKVQSGRRQARRAAAELDAGDAEIRKRVTKARARAAGAGRGRAA